MVVVDVERPQGLPRPRGGTHRPSDLKRLLEQVAEGELERLQNLRKKRPIHHRYEYEDLEEFKAFLSNGRRRLEKFDRALQYMMTMGKKKLGHLQHKLMRAVRMAAIKKMCAFSQSLLAFHSLIEKESRFGDDLVNNIDFLKEKYGIRDIYDIVAILFPRRSGKTVTEVIATAVLAISQPGGNIAVFNLTGRQARAFLRQVIEYLEIFKGSPEFDYVVVNKDLREFIIIRSVAAGTDNAISSFPGGQGGNFDNLRGMGIKLFGIFMDEACFFNPMIMTVIAPLLATGAFLVMTSSISGGGARAGVMAMLDAHLPDGSLVVHELNFIRACDMCRLKKQEGHSFFYLTTVSPGLGSRSFRRVQGSLFHSYLFIIL
jgi:hypothetical protein